jgi:hypothetical protein
MSVGSDDSGSSDLTSYYFLNCDTGHGQGSKDTPFVCSAGCSSDEESIGSIARQPPGRRPVTMFMISSIMSRETKPRRANASRALIVVDVATLRPSPVMMIVLTPSLEKSGRFLAMP